ncbi:MAG: D-amino-acid transaminase [Arcobacter sp.]|nr:MAG: D-amino-acid transaminase [Arcobacter sp.]
MIVFIDGEYVKEEDAKVSVNDRAYVFADGAYEGFRVYNEKIFKYEEHKIRFQRSLDELRIDHVINNEIQDIYEELKKVNNYENVECFYYMHITRGQSPRAHAFPSKKSKVGIYAFLMPKALNIRNYEEGISVCTVPDNRWARCDIKCISLIANCLASQIAVENDCAEALFVHDGVITEGTKTNVCFVKNNEVYTHAKTNRILAGVTRNSLLELCVKNGITVHEFPLTLDKLKDMDEAFLTGTTEELTPIITIDGKKVGSGEVGSLTKKLQKIFKEEVNRYSY